MTQWVSIPVVLNTAIVYMSTYLVIHNVPGQKGTCEAEHQSEPAGVEHVRNTQLMQRRRLDLTQHAQGLYVYAETLNNLVFCELNHTQIWNVSFW